MGSYARSPALSVRCAAGSLREPPLSVTLVSSARGPLVQPALELTVPLRSAPRIRRTALCTQQAYDAGGLEARAPGHLDFWLRYHTDVLGVEDVYLYDVDGSFADHPTVAYLRAQDRLVYSAAFARIPPMAELFETHGVKYRTAYLLQGLVQHHCWQQARHGTEWLFMVPHAWDMLLFSPEGAPVSELVDTLAE